jgi:hypothetical protein
MNAEHVSQNTMNELTARLAHLERSNRRMKRMGAALALGVVCVIALGFQAAARDITANEISARQIKANSILVESEKGTVRIDDNGIALITPGISTQGKSNIVEYENRIELGFDYEWKQDNFLRPTPRIAVGRTGRDTARNTVTRYAVISPEGLHSGEWHTNNPKHTGRTDRDLIENLRR